MLSCSEGLESFAFCKIQRLSEEQKEPSDWACRDQGHQSMSDIEMTPSAVLTWRASEIVLEGCHRLTGQTQCMRSKLPAPTGTSNDYKLKACPARCTGAPVCTQIGQKDGWSQPVRPISEPPTLRFARGSGGRL